MVILSRDSVLDLRQKYREGKAHASLNVLDKLINIASLNEDKSLPSSFDIESTFCDYDTIKEVIKDIGVPPIYIRAVFRVRQSFHVQLYNQ